MSGTNVFAHVINAVSGFRYGAFSRIGAGESAANVTLPVVIRWAKGQLKLFIPIAFLVSPANGG